MDEITLEISEAADAVDFSITEAIENAALATDNGIVTKGEKGEKGDKGDKGDPGGSYTYVFEQTTASSAWNVTHNLDKYPSVTVVDSANNVVVGDVLYVDRNNVAITFSGAFSGAAYFN